MRRSFKRSCSSIKSQGNNGFTMAIGTLDSSMPKTLIRRKCNQVEELFLQEGTQCFDDTTLKNEATKFFSSLFQDEGGARLRLCLEGLPSLDNKEMSRIMEEVTKKEVWEAI